MSVCLLVAFFFSSRRRHTRWPRDWSSDVCSSDLIDIAYRLGIPTMRINTGRWGTTDSFDELMENEGKEPALERSEERRVGKDSRLRVRGATTNRKDAALAISEIAERARRESTKQP